MRQLICCVVVGLVLLLGYSSVSIAQNSFKSEADQIKQAEKYFNADQFSKALPLFSNIVSNRPDNAHYNYCFGVCIVEAGAEKDNAVRYLKLASTSPQTPSNVSLYLARALHAGGHFEEALVALDDFKNVTSRSDWSQSIAEELNGNCNTGITNRVPTNTTEHRILKSSDVSFNNFSQKYVFENSQGKFLKLPKEYESKNSVGYTEAEYLFISGDDKIMVLSRKDFKNDHGFDIWNARKEFTGTFNDPVKMNSPINSTNNEAFATITNGGRTIYFSKKGKTSIGGYDIFRSDLNTQTGLWSPPQNLGTPVNSPGNEYYYLPSSDNSYCYFLTDRNSSQDNYQVVKASIRDLDNNSTVINGKIDCKSCPSNMEIKISINSVSDNSLLQEIKVLPSEPEYTLWLNAPEKYVFTVSAPGFPIYTDVVDLKKVLKAGYSQHILITRNSTGQEEMKIITSELNNEMLAAQPSNMNNDLSGITSDPDTESLNKELISGIDEDDQDPDSKLSANDKNGQHELSGIEITGNSANSDQNSEKQKQTESMVSVVSAAPASSNGVDADNSESNGAQSSMGENPGTTRSDETALEVAEPSLPEVNIDHETTNSGSMRIVATGSSATSNDVDTPIESNDAHSSAKANTNTTGSDEKSLEIAEQSLPEINVDHETNKTLGASTNDSEKEQGQIASADLQRNVEQVNQVTASTIELLEVQNENGIITGDFETNAATADNNTDANVFDEKNSDLVSSEINSTDNQLTIADDSQVSDSNRLVNVEEASSGQKVSETTADVNTTPLIKNSSNGSKKGSSNTSRDGMSSLSATGTNAINTTSEDGVITGEFMASEASIPDEDPDNSSASATSAVESNELAAHNKDNAGLQSQVDSQSEDAFNSTAKKSDLENTNAISLEKGSKTGNVNFEVQDESYTQKLPSLSKQESGVDLNQDEQHDVNTNDGTSVEYDNEGSRLGVSSATQNSSAVPNQNQPKTDVVKSNQQSGSEIDRLNNIDQVALSGSTEVSGNSIDRSVVDGEFDAELSALNAEEDQSKNNNEIIGSENEIPSSTEANKLKSKSKIKEEVPSSVERSAESEYMISAEAKAAYPNIVFKVQVGAFQKSEAQKLVALYESKGLQLVSNAVNDGITTVMSGSFTSYNDARIQREKIREEGFKDAFVVVYSEKTRLNVSEVLQLAVTE